MSINTLSLFTCPYCGDGLGQIIVNAAALASLRRKHPHRRTSELTLADDQEIITFNTGRQISEPCEHLVQISVEFAWGPKTAQDFVRQTWGACFDWYSPAADESDSDELGDELLWDTLSQGPKDARFIPKQPYTFLNDQPLRWEDFAAEDKTRPFFQVEGSAVFAQDIPEFFAELRKLAERRQEIWAAERGETDPQLVAGG